MVRQISYKHSTEDHKQNPKNASDTAQSNFDTSKHFVCNIATITSMVINCLTSDRITVLGMSAALLKWYGKSVTNMVMPNCQKLRNQLFNFLSYLSFQACLQLCLKRYGKSDTNIVVMIARIILNMFPTLPQACLIQANTLIAISQSSQAMVINLVPDRNHRSRHVWNFVSSGTESLIQMSLAKQLQTPFLAGICI